ncbi:MAG: serine/threonine protein kinase [Polyangiaceae bacterium]|nr:serine/threonine protein kinase [Polyangiaceae bacterium]
MELQHPSAATAAELHNGAVIAGRYRVDARVGAGGMGAVFSGEHLAVGVKVALKQLLVSAAENHEVVARFRREAVFLGKIRSDHVARVLDFVTDEKYGLILVMEFIEGDPLSKILGTRTLSVEETIELGADISAALVDLHRHSIVHRDLKPGNIIWQNLPNGSHRAVIVDFGVSRILQQGVEEDEEMTGITRADMALGTIEYMAPEQILNSRDVTASSDIYALGAILFRAHAGKHVFGDVYDAELAKKKIWTDPPSLQTGRTDKLSRGLEAVVNRALTRSPKKRYAQADEVLTELNMLRDLMKAAAFDIDTMTTRDNSAILEALAVAEAKSQGASAPPPAKDSAAKDPASTKDPPASAQPVSAPAQSSGSLSAAASSIPSEPRVVKKGISPAVFVIGFLAAAVGGVFLGTRLGPTAGGLFPAAPGAESAVATATATAAPAQTAAASATTSAPEPTAAPTSDATAAPTSAAADTAAADPGAEKPKLYGKLPDTKGGSATTAAATATAATATTATTAPSAAPTPKATTTGKALPPGPAPTITKEPDL